MTTPATLKRRGSSDSIDEDSPSVVHSPVVRQSNSFAALAASLGDENNITNEKRRVKMMIWEKGSLKC